MYQDWDEDTKTYILIKIYPEEQRLGIRICDAKTHKPLMDIFGKTPQECYNTAIIHGHITKLQHAAYLGKELMKAFVCLKQQRPYEQDEDEEGMFQ